MLSEFIGPNSPWADITCIRADISLTARFNPRWDVVVDVQRIGGINIAFTTGNNVGISSSFKEILAPRDTTLSGPDHSQNKFSQSEQSRLCFVSLKCTFLNKVGSVGNLNQLRVTLFVLLFTLQQNVAQ